MIINLEPGDWVECKLKENDPYYFKGAKQIKAICDDWIILSNDDRKHLPKNLILVCGFKRGQYIEIIEGMGAIFVQYRPELIDPFECVLCGYTEEFKANKPYKTTFWPKALRIQERGIK